MSSGSETNMLHQLPSMTFPQSHSMMTNSKHHRGHDDHTGLMAGAAGLIRRFSVSIGQFSPPKQDYGRKLALWGGK